MRKITPARPSPATYTVEHHYGSYLVTRYHRGRKLSDELIQTDWDYPATAQNLGWSLTRVQKRNGTVKHLSRRPVKGCSHSDTDGTVFCPDCDIPAGDFINAAAEYLDSLC